MKVLRDGKEVKDAIVSYFADGTPDVVTVKGVNYDPSAFTFEGGKTQTKTKASKATGAMTTKKKSGGLLNRLTGKK